MRSTCPLFLISSLAAPGCFYDPSGSVADSVGNATTSTGPSEEGSSTGSPEPAQTTGPTTGDHAVCGDAILDDGEECDNGALNNGQSGSICKGNCLKNVCGDDYVASNEECDDGNLVDGDLCSALCSVTFCGDGTVDPNEECDNGGDNGDGTACTLKCRAAVCGDGLLWEGVEACDDGNSDNEDECNACVACGNGLVEPPEECDLGPSNDYFSSCLPGCIAAYCGDGYISSMELCDDGNTENGDGCSSMCVTE